MTRRMSLHRRSSVLLFALVFAFGCRRDHAVPSAAAIRANLSAFRGFRPDSAIRLTRVIPGDWTETYIFPPNTSKELIARCMNGASNADSKGIEGRDDIDLLLIRTVNGALVSREVPRGPPELSVAGPAVYDSTAVFQVRRDADRALFVPISGTIRRCN
jgi:hypothetical protein